MGSDMNDNRWSIVWRKSGDLEWKKSTTVDHALLSKEKARETVDRLNVQRPEVEWNAMIFDEPEQNRSAEDVLKDVIEILKSDDAPWGRWEPGWRMLRSQLLAVIPEEMRGE